MRPKNMNLKEYKTSLIRRLHGIGKKLGLDHAGLSEMSWSNYDCGMGDLTILQLKQMTQKLTSKPSPQRNTNRKEKAIYAIAYGRLKWDASRIKDFIEQQTGSRKSVQNLSEPEYNKVITGLEAVEKYYKKHGAE